jgi:hypothetical protein
LSAPGICHNLPLTGSPLATEVTQAGADLPVGHLVIGYLYGQPVVVDSPSMAWLDELETAIRTERGRITMWHQDHRVQSALIAAEQRRQAAAA